eukprot:Opistho-2@4799
MSAHAADVADMSASSTATDEQHASVDSPSAGSVADSGASQLRGIIRARLSSRIISRQSVASKRGGVANDTNNHEKNGDKRDVLSSLTDGRFNAAFAACGNPLSSREFFLVSSKGCDVQLIHTLRMLSSDYSGTERLVAAIDPLAVPSAGLPQERADAADGALQASEHEANLLRVRGALLRQGNRQVLVDFIAARWGHHVVVGEEAHGGRRYIVVSSRATVSTLSAGTRPAVRLVIDHDTMTVLLFAFDCEAGRGGLTSPGDLHVWCNRVSGGLPLCGGLARDDVSESTDVAVAQELPYRGLRSHRCAWFPAAQQSATAGAQSEVGAASPAALCEARGSASLNLGVCHACKDVPQLIRDERKRKRKASAAGLGVGSIPGVVDGAAVHKARRTSSSQHVFVFD